MDELKNISEQFQIEGEVRQLYSFGSGHINDTFKIETDIKNYILQRVNATIFHDVPGLMQNIVVISEFLLNQPKDDKIQVLTPVMTKDGKHLHKDGSGEFWRVFYFIESSESFNRVENADIAFEGGKVYGWFVRSLSDFPLNKLKVTLPRFHDIQFRLDNFLKAMETDVCYRVELVPEEINYVFNRAEEMQIISDLGNEGKIPLRVTHNDTKINNVLFNRENEGICVIDLDTVMPGYSLFDFGDAVRTFANSADEDEKDLDKIS
ncbi:MAG: aminoglycoside phosphotransferase family protein [Bacteroidales bacterium]